MNRATSGRRQRGWSLLEALVAAAVLEILLVGLAAGLAALVRCEHEIRNCQEELIRAWNEAEQWRATAEEPLGPKEGGVFECTEMEVRRNVTWVVCRTR